MIALGPSCQCPHSAGVLQWYVRCIACGPFIMLISLCSTHPRRSQPSTVQVCYGRFYGKVKMAAATMTVIEPLFSS